MPVLSQAPPMHVTLRSHHYLPERYHSYSHCTDEETETEIKIAGPIHFKKVAQPNSNTAGIVHSV